MIYTESNGGVTTNVLTMLDPAGKQAKVAEKDLPILLGEGYSLAYQDYADYRRHLRRIKKRRYRRADIAALKGKHAGRKIVVLGNGPSLNFYEPARFRRHIVVAVNYITAYLNDPHYLLFSDADFFYMATGALAGISRRSVVFCNGGAVEASKRFNPVSFHRKKFAGIDAQGRFALGGSILMAAQLAEHISGPGDRIEVLGVDYRDYEGKPHYTDRGVDFSYADFKRFAAPFNRLIGMMARSGRRWVNLSPISRLAEYGVETEYPRELEEIARSAGSKPAGFGQPAGEYVFKKTVAANLHIENPSFDIRFGDDGLYSTDDPKEIAFLLDFDRAVLVRRPR